ncbi:unnamed protein product, partial [marine sediment metagenome]
DATFRSLRTQAHDRLESFENYSFLETSSSDAVGTFYDESLDFVYIDGNHMYDYVKSDITEWSKKVRPGGIVAGHDYMHSKKATHIEVRRAIHDYTEEQDIKTWFVLGDYRAKAGEVRDPSRSWMFIKS